MINIKKELKQFAKTITKPIKVNNERIRNEEKEKFKRKFGRYPKPNEYY